MVQSLLRVKAVPALAQLPTKGWDLGIHYSPLIKTASAAHPLLGGGRQRGSFQPPPLHLMHQSPFV